MALKYKVTSKELDKSNGNVVVTFDAWDDANAPGVIDFPGQKTWANDFTDETLTAFIAKRVAVLFEGRTALAAVTVHSAAQDVPAVTVDPKRDAIRIADLAFRQAFQLAQVRALNDPDALDKYNALQAAIADVAK